ncbi:MAG TPA: hypothetical protein VIM64_11540 [Puia sp.]
MQENKTVDLTQRVKLYAPAGAKHHKEGEETLVGALLADKFRAMGYTDAPAAKSAKKGGNV